ncbi:DUF721 domain-containing protein [Prochlorococcus sp. MIT 1223]|uniref:DUF721 domain-containing protein n=1 Tax=Prochlorococcus sp. MIT 1223 TaxID=3096217 RepID=UPI002A7527D8|nr:DUF721 domain-containing protein [Prochlorococcus sp. MIT 1223]
MQKKIHSNKRSLSSCLDQIKNDWKQTSKLAALSHDWANLVGKKLASNCTPLSLKRGTLVIGASHPQWRQALLYTKSQLLNSLVNAGYEIKDIRIQQFHFQKKKAMETESVIWEKHPSRIDIHGLKICPKCKKPAPIGELKRWSMCCFCKRKDLPK